MAATTAQLLGLRIARRQANQHSLGRFKQVPDSKDPNTRFGPEYYAVCRYCDKAVIVYFPYDDDELIEQSLDPNDAQTVRSVCYGNPTETLMTVKIPKCVGENHE